PDLLMRLAQARQRTGDTTSAATLLQEGRELARASGRTADIAAIERRLGLGAFISGNPTAALLHLDAAEESARQARAFPLAVRSRIARAIALLSIGRAAEGRQLIDSALSDTDLPNDPALLARLHRAMVLLYSWTGPASIARQHGELSLAHASTARDPAVSWSVHWALALMAGLSGDGSALKVHLTAAEALATQLRAPLLLAQSAEIAIEFASVTGAWTDGLQLAERHIPIARALAPHTLLPRLLVWSGIMRLERDEIDVARAQFQEAWDIANASTADGERVDTHVVIPACIGLATLHLRLHNFAEAIAHAEHGLALADRLGATTWAIHRLLPILCEAHIWLNDFDRAESLARRLREESLVLEHPLGLAYAQATEALLQRFRDGRADAHVPLVAAADRLEAIPFLFPAARLRLNAAHVLMLDERNDEALQQLRACEEAFARMGAVRELRIVRERLRLVGSRPRRHSEFSFAERELTTREQEIVTLVAAGKTNKEIAAALRLRVRTIDAHLRRMFAKCGVRTRAGLVGAVAR
ncbi:MAG: LuxR C-terminal-related transcriptional regulator, partial [Gemmatimonadaceae bacterium]